MAMRQSSNKDNGLGGLGIGGMGLSGMGMNI